MTVPIAQCEFQIPAEISEIKPASERLLELLGDTADFDFIVAIQEALTNAVVHGCRLDPTKSVCCTAERDDENMIVTISDPGPGYDFLHPPDPTSGDAITKFSGRGLHMIRLLVDKVEFEQRGATIRMTRRYPHESESVD